MVHVSLSVPGVHGMGISRMTEQVLPELPPREPCWAEQRHSLIHAARPPPSVHLPPERTHPEHLPQAGAVWDRCSPQPARSPPGGLCCSQGCTRLHKVVQMRKLGGVVRAVEGRFLRADAALLLGSTGEETGPGEERSGPRRGVAWPG